MIQALEERLRCPACGSGLDKKANAYGCASCARTFPTVQGVPVLLDESNSMFRIDECAALAGEKKKERPATVVREAVQSMLPHYGRNAAARENIALLARLLHEEAPTARILVLGGARLGVGCEALANDPAFTLVECDVLFGPRTNLVCDAHQIPFADGTFDAVVAQGVFEYLKDPFRVASEIHRVLRPGGLVYAESPFLQHVHGGANDFFRYTPAGHRLVFRLFDEIKNGITAGPGTVLTWSYRYFLRSFMARPATRFLADIVASLSAFWLSRLDRFLLDRPGAQVGASGVYFLGRRSERPLTDRELLKTYKGLGVMGY